MNLLEKSLLPKLIPSTQRDLISETFECTTSCWVIILNKVGMAFITLLYSSIEYCRLYLTQRFSWDRRLPCLSISWDSAQIPLSNQVSKNNDLRLVKTLFHKGEISFFTFLSRVKWHGHHSHVWKLQPAAC